MRAQTKPRPCLYEHADLRPFWCSLCLSPILRFSTTGSEEDFR